MAVKLPSGCWRLLLATRVDSPRSRVNLVASSDINESQWPHCIKALVEAGLVIRVGTKGGATYLRSPTADISDNSPWKDVEEGEADTTWSETNDTTPRWDDGASDDGYTEIEDRVLNALSTNVWRSRQEVYAIADISESDWRQATNRLLETGRIQRQGEKRWTTYRRIESHPDDSPQQHQTLGHPKASYHDLLWECLEETAAETVIEPQQVEKPVSAVSSSPAPSAAPKVIPFDEMPTDPGIPIVVVRRTAKQTTPVTESPTSRAGFVSLKQPPNRFEVENKSGPTRDGSLDPILARLQSAGNLEVIDKRSAGGALWVVHSLNARQMILQLSKEFQIQFHYAEAGGRATGGRAAWWSHGQR